METEIKWTQFWDMHSGGGTKEEPYEQIYIEAPEAEAKIIFYNRFGHNPERVSCTCCGDDYSISESNSLMQATAFQRGCAYGKEEKEWVERPDGSRTLVSLEDYVLKPDVLVIRAEEIKPEERIGEVPEQGYVWK